MKPSTITAGPGPRPAIGWGDFETHGLSPRTAAQVSGGWGLGWEAQLRMETELLADPSWPLDKQSTGVLISAACSGAPITVTSVQRTRGDGSLRPLRCTTQETMNVRQMFRGAGHFYAQRWGFGNSPVRLAEVLAIETPARAHIIESWAPDGTDYRRDHDRPRGYQPPR